ncbi:DUF2768 family protein [Microaerobacter geothermalis]|uniref:DUF2768 family protein n=1 Tax=Microaerobacter geothermalis TaxID=674972 RepID=UPI001F1ACADA|nr:DUF2768 family protein [Microaerobacter geothermalis]MCF6093532.1 DUF2768 family protein [Microaerobacter geothermalis]
MLEAFIAIFLLILANLLITLARHKLHGFLKRIVTIFAYLLLIPAFIFGLRVIF